MKSIDLSLCLLLLPAGSLTSEAAPAQPAATATQLVQRAIPFIESEGANWIEKRDCLSCHHTSFMVWSLNSAKSLGFEIDALQLSDWNTWATNWKHHVARKNRADATHDKVLREANDALSQLIIGGTYQHAGNQAIGKYLKFLVDAQNENGSWKAGGQLPQQKRSTRETTEASTLWALIALSSAPDRRGEFRASIDEGLAWLGDQTIGESTEWWAARTLLARKLGDESAAAHYATALRKRQHPDGGWGWLCADESDALGTAQALYALAGESAPITDPAVAGAITFLDSTQRSDGSWRVKGTKKKSENEETPTAVFWGTSWTVIALSQFLAHSSAE